MSQDVTSFAVKNVIQRDQIMWIKIFQEGAPFLEGA